MLVGCALHDRRCSRSDRALIRQGLPARFRWLVDIARPDAESGIESLLRLRLLRLGIALVGQVLILGVGRLDFLLADWIIPPDQVVMTTRGSVVVEAAVDFDGAGVMFLAG